MAYFNLSVCFAKCGYLDKALEVLLNTKVGLLSEECDFHILAKYNKAIFSLLKVPFKIEEALSTMTEVISHISSKELSHWLNASSLQSNCQSLLVMINKLSIWEMQIMQT